MQQARNNAEELAELKIPPQPLVVIAIYNGISPARSSS
jgi:propanediol dehydratase small subunit